jgi:hypothetical protein
MNNYETQFNKYVAATIDETAKHGINVHQIDWLGVMLEARRIFNERYIEV